MSNRNVELLRRYVEAFNTRAIEAFIAFCDPQIELHSAVTVPGGAVYHGHDGVRRWHRDLEDGWGGELQIEPEAYFDLGEDTLAFYVAHARGRQSRAEVAMPNAFVAKWRNDLVVYFKRYLDRQDALRDLGVSADELEPIEP
jgi:hypothetical protein